MKINYLFLIALLSMFMGCQKTVLEKTSGTGNDLNDATQTMLTTVDGFSSDHLYNLNVIYFIPNDLDTIPGYEKRLSEILLWGQDYFADEMDRNGYPGKTFGLLTNAQNRVKIITIRGNLPKSGYPYSGGNAAVSQEINAYFALHPEENTGPHSLIILPRYEFRPDGTPSGGPFYGTGKWCYALDYEGLDIANIGQTDAEGNRFTVWFGGMIHELGHGLNLPHNCQKVSENATLGMALMWAGNSTLGTSPTFLTAADCAILNVNQIFNKTAGSYYGPVTAKINRIQASYSSTKAAIVVSGKFTSNTPVTSIIYYNDPNVNNEGTGVNRDYNAVTWESKKIGTDSFYVEMPISEFAFKDESPYELKVKLVHTNGNVTETIYNYDFINNLPVLLFSSKSELSKANWSIANFSSEETAGENGAATNLIDEDSGTYWHSRWSSSSATFPHQVTIDMGSPKLVKGISLTQRGGLQRAIKDIDILYSTDGTAFTNAITTTLSNSNGAQYRDLPAPQTFRYIRLNAKNAHDGLTFAALAEIGAY